MLCKLSISNIKKSFRDYAIYFVTLILGVCIFYIFNSMDSQTAMLAVTSRTGEMIKMITNLLSYVSIFVSCILGFLIIYASRFLIKKRNKEFGIYMTLGMSKRRISILLLIETFLIGLISLAIGLLLGVGLSQVTSIFIANMFEADMTKFTFNFSQAAMFKTMMYFGIIYFIVMIFNTIIVNKNKLINLLQASKKQEKIKLKNPILCVILFILSVAMIGTAYYMVTDGLEELTKYEVSILLLPISLGVVGTVMFFYSVAGMMLKVLSRCRKMYAKNLNTFVFKQVSSKINTMVVSVSVICLMLFITLCMLSSAFTIKDYFNNSINKYAPVDFEVIATYNEEYEGEINLNSFIENDNTLKNNTKDVTIVTSYHAEGFDYGKSLGKYYDDIKEKYPYLEFDTPVSVMSESDYNKLAKILKYDTVHLKEDEYAIICDYEKDIYEEVIKRESTMNIFGKELKPYKRVIEGFQMISVSPSNIGFFVVNDNILKTDNKEMQILVGNYNTEDKQKIDEMENKVEDYSPEFAVIKETRAALKESTVGLKAIVTFIGLYVGIIFLISSSAILALKELSDCIDDKNKYKVLRQIGADEKDINKALFKQTLIFFMLPLSVAVIHTIFGLKFCTILLKSMGIENMLDGSVATFIFLIVIYGIYFGVTYLCGKNIIKDKIC